jgi:hypothetical protein
MQENPKSPASLSATSAAAALVVVRGHVRTCPIPCIGRSERQRSDRLGNARATARAQTRNSNRLPRRSEAAKALVRSLPPLSDHPTALSLFVSWRSLVRPLGVCPPGKVKRALLEDHERATSSTFPARRGAIPTRVTTSAAVKAAFATALRMLPLCHGIWAWRSRPSLSRWSWRSLKRLPDMIDSRSSELPTWSARRDVR